MNDVPEGKTTRYQKNNFIFNKKLSVAHIKGRNTNKIRHFSTTIEDLNKQIVPLFTDTNALYKIVYAVIPANKIHTDIEFFNISLEQELITKGVNSPSICEYKKSKLTPLNNYEIISLSKRNNLLIPCIIMDYENEFKYSYHPNQNELHEYLSEFNISYSLNDQGIIIDNDKNITPIKTKLQHAKKRNMS